MNRTALERLLEAESVRPDAYSLYGDVRDECLCLLPAEGGWVVFYSERGAKTGLRHFETEDEACDFMSRRLLADRGNRVHP